MSILYYAAPVWSDIAECHIKRLQISQNKLLKMKYNLSWHFSTQCLHSINNINKVEDRILKHANNYNNRCETSEYDHINILNVNT